MMHAHGLSRLFGATGGHYKASIQGRVPVPDSKTGWSDKAGFVLQGGPKVAEVAPARLDINPLCLNPHGIAHVRAILELIGIQWHWVQHGRVTRADGTFDFYGFTPDEFVWDIPQRRKRGLWLDDDRLLTLYLGSKHSDHVCIYDKGREQKQGTDVRHTRLEFRMLKLGSVQHLPNVASPLANLLVVDPRKIQTIIPPLRLAMKTQGQAKGVKGVLSLFPPNTHHKNLSDLKATTPSWWCPDELWSQWPSVLHASLPDLFEVDPGAAALMASYQKFDPLEAHAMAGLGP